MWRVAVAASEDSRCRADEFAMAHPRLRCATGRALVAGFHVMTLPERPGKVMNLYGRTSLL